MSKIIGLESSLISLVKEYQSLNSSKIDEIDFTPTSLEFSKYVGLNRPLIIRNQGKRDQIAALERWSNSYLTETLGNKKVRVAVTPSGCADWIVDDMFIEPDEVEMTLSEFFPLLNNSDLNAPVYYLQSQNGNLSADGELSTLYDDVGEGPSFAREVFAAPHEVANVWIGDGRSVTSTHKDPYENIYSVIRGSKSFTLLPPTEFYTLHEQLYTHAKYSYTPSTLSSTSTPSSFKVIPTTPSLKIPWIPIDIENPDLELYPRFVHAKPYTFTLHAGDMLYLPSLWYHRVAQTSGPSPSEEDEVEAAIAVNWWFDMSYAGFHWSLAQFVRRMTLALDGREEENGLLDDD